MAITADELYFKYSGVKQQQDPDFPKIDESEVLRVEIKTSINDQLEVVNKQEEELIAQLEKLVALKKEIEKHYVPPPPPVIVHPEVNHQDIQIPEKKSHKRKHSQALEFDEEASTISDESDFLSNGNVPQKTSKKTTKKSKVIKEPKPKRLRETKVCHVCHRQFVPSELLTCTGITPKGKRCGISFCQPCLKRRHGEDYNQAQMSGCWVCAKCRGNCGEGCVICCTCGTCRKNAKLPIVSKISQDLECVPAEFDNMHDCIVHLATGESVEKIRSRKTLFSWGRFLTVTENPASTVQNFEETSLQTEQQIQMQNEFKHQEYVQ